MKKSLSRQFIAILLIPILIILATNYYIISYIRQSQNENLRHYCASTIDNIEINISTMTTSMKKTSTLLSSKSEMQSYLRNAVSDQHQLQRQPFFNLIDLSRSYTPDLLDIVVWDKVSPTSMISYIPADMESFAVGHFQDEDRNTKNYFEFYTNPNTSELYLMYFCPVFTTTFSENFGSYLGNIAVICKTNTLSRLVNSASDLYVNITDTESGQLLYSNNYAPENTKASDYESYKTTNKVRNTNLTITGTVYNSQMNLFKTAQTEPLLLMAVLSIFYIIYIAIAVHRMIIRPIRLLNAEIESIDHDQDEMRIQNSLKNEIGSIASHVNALLARVSSLNQRNIASQARLYEMELSEKQTQIYAYQSQINPHFLYNMLQCMRGISLMHGIPEVAQICTNMADLFRYSIKGALLVHLKDEVSIIDKYLYMIRIRFQDRITYHLEIDDDTRECWIPKMILQPLVENAIFHGLESTEEDGMVLIRAFRKEEHLYITIWDNGIGFAKEILEELEPMLREDIPTDINTTYNESKGLGIMNIHNKIRLYEGNGYGIRIDSAPGDTVVTLHLNAQQKKDLS